MKKTVLIFMSILMLMTAFVISANAETVTGSCGDNVTYTLTDEGVLTISGTGDMSDNYGHPNYMPWYASRDSITTVVVEQGITKLGKNAFRGCVNLTSVSIPDSVIRISQYVFSGCSSLETIDIPDTVIYMSGQVFQDCSSLKSIELPPEITTIYASVFKNCTSLKKVVIPSKVRDIYSAAFEGCTALESVIIPASVKWFTDNNGAIFKDCPSTLVIYGVKGSAAETYANSKSITFKELPIISHSVFAQQKFDAANMTAVKIKVDNASETTVTGLQIVYNGVAKNLANTVVEGKGSTLIGVFVPGTVDVTADDFKISAINY